MRPSLTGEKYDRIADHWHEEQQDSSYGVAQIRRAIAYAPPGAALDVGCGAGGRIMHALEAASYSVTGLDVSSRMLAIAQKHHPDAELHLADISEWESDSRFELIIAWDSTFHLPQTSQEPVVRKLCGLLSPGGILAYTFGDNVGEHESEWLGDTFYYSSIGIHENVRAIQASGCSLRHLELDQFPERHVYLIARKDA